MIIYDLECCFGHKFEAWFPSCDEYEMQNRDGMVHCALCGVDEVRRMPSGGYVGGAGGKPEKTQSVSLKQGLAPVAGNDKTFNADPAVFLKMMHHFVEKNFKNVGPDFAKKAIEMHQGKSTEKPIYGDATPEERVMLEEEGIPFATLPKIPKDN